MSNNEYFTKLKIDFQNIIIDKSQITETKTKLGSGKFAKVFIGQYKGNSVAIKKYEIDRKSLNKLVEKEEELKNLYSEITSMLTLNSSSNDAIPELYGIVVQEESDEIWYIMQKIEGTNLKEFIENEKNVPESRKVKISIKIAETIEYIHKKGLIHRDLKPENIMINQAKDDEIYIIDFGLCKIKDFSKEYTRTGVKGTPLYSSPENFCFIESSGFIKGSEINFKADVWSFGCVLYEFFSGKIPWEEKFKNHKPEIINALYYKHILKVKELFMSNDFKEKYTRISEIINSCTKTSISERYDISQAKEMLINYYLSNFIQVTQTNTYLGNILKENALYEIAGKLEDSDFTYEGEFYYGKKSGFGVEVNRDNEVYTGEWKVDNWDGYGILEKRTENDRIITYSWKYRNDFALGKMINEEEEFIYEGEFDKTDPYGTGYYIDLKNNKEYFGIGSWYIPNIEIGYCKDIANDCYYEGQFSGIDYEGFGVLVNNKDKTVYEGEFRENKKNGFGCLSNENKIPIYQGEWVDDKKHGIGKLFNEEGNVVYIGKFSDDEKE
jgi:serine/threonine protein kinase